MSDSSLSNNHLIVSTTPFKHLSKILLIAANVIPIVGVLAWDWDVRGILVLYWSENLVLGFYTIVKMIHKSPLGGVFASLFFLVHFGGFCAVHGYFILGMTGQDVVSLGGEWPFVLIFVEMLVEVVRSVIESAPREWLLSFAAIAISHGVSLVINYFGRKEHERETVNSLMHAPYRRIVVLHIAIIGGGFFVLSLGSPLALLVVLVVLKIAIDVYLHVREHRRPESDAEHAGVTANPRHVAARSSVN